MIDHDRIFKELLQTFFVEFVDLFLPDVAKYLDRTSLEFLDKEVFTDITAGEKFETDVIIKARVRGKKSFFLIHIENQATAQSHFNRRMFFYFAWLHQKFGLPVYPIAIFSYAAPLRPEPDRYQIRFPAWQVLQFNFRAIQLNQLNWRNYLKQKNPVAAALMAKMKIAPDERWRVKAECLRLIATLKLNRAKMKLIANFIDVYLQLSQQEEKKFHAVVESFAPKEKAVIMEYLNTWEKKGLAQGLQQGLQRERMFLLRVLTRQLGKVSRQAEAKIQKLSIAELDKLEIALDDFTTPQDLDNWLREL